MNEKDLVETWNDMRKQIIQAQFQSVIALSVVTVLSVMGYFSGVSTTVALFALAFLVTVGSLGVLNQFAIIREAKALVEDLKGHSAQGAMGKTISGSGSYLTLTQGLMVVFSIALVVLFALVALSL
ncbi:MAG: hypothetical protein O2828_00225 [Actinomycetota bacterium]|nr:hypothetical protein [Actinomycetota bacterium]MDA3002986.1 hypothetical protein [Actinomycetota bacterium]